MFTKLIDLHIYLEYLFIEYHYHRFLWKWKYASHIPYNESSIAKFLFLIYYTKVLCIVVKLMGFLVTFQKNCESNVNLYTMI